jgi:hypothetical protein
MFRLACLAVATALVLSPDVGGAPRSQPAQQSQSKDQSAPATAPASGAASGPQQQTAKSDIPLQEESRMMILRNVDRRARRLIRAPCARRSNRRAPR